MFQKSLCIALAFCLASAMLGCGNSSQPTDSNTTDPQVTAPHIVQTIPTTGADEIPVFEETILVDDDSCTFKIVSVDADNLWGYTLKAYLENKTDRELIFSMDQVSVNGFMCDPFWAASITSGMKSNEEISFSSADFERNGITDVTEIRFVLRVYDNNDLSADYLVNEDFTIYPMGEDLVTEYIRTPLEGEIVLFDDENCTMIVTGLDPDGLWGYTMDVYLENKTDTVLMFSADGVAVNGFMCDPFWAESIAPGARSNTSISWLESDFTDNGITKVESITLPLRVYDENNWNRADFISETFTIHP